MVSASKTITCPVLADFISWSVVWRGWCSLFRERTMLEPYEFDSCRHFGNLAPELSTNIVWLLVIDPILMSIADWNPWEPNRIGGKSHQLDYRRSALWWILLCLSLNQHFLLRFHQCYLQSYKGSKNWGAKSEQISSYRDWSLLSQLQSLKSRLGWHWRANFVYSCQLSVYPTPKVPWYKHWPSVQR